MLSEARS